MIKSLYFIFTFLLFTTSGAAQELEKSYEKSSEIDFSDRQAIIESIENFFIGDHTGSVKHKKLSMHEKGAYRYVNRAGEYSEGVFQLDSNDADPGYEEELQSIEIYDRLALARIRLVHDGAEVPSYKLLTLHKVKSEWKITSITWGTGITH